MKVYLIILLIYFNSIVSQLSNNESLLVFHKYNTYKRGLFTAKFGKTINQIKESDSDLLVETHNSVSEIDYSLSANVIIWPQYEYYNSRFLVFYAIPMDKR
jgi:hypothetical protein